MHQPNTDWETMSRIRITAVPTEPQTALKWYAKAADQGFAEAELALSHWYLTGTPATALGDPEHLEST